MIGLIIPAFIAGLLTFFAPCTFPLVPAYLAFISGGAIHPTVSQHNHWKVLINAALYVFGFSAVFILLGTAFAFGGQVLFMYRFLLAQIGGVIIIFFGIFLLGASNWSIFAWLNFERRWFNLSWLHPGKPVSAFLLGATFAFGWTPCIGPILGAVLLLAAHTATVGEGAALLTVFSAGLAIPFLLLALGIGSAGRFVKKLTPFVPVISVVGGVLLILFGTLMVTNHLEIWNHDIYKWFSFFHYDSLLDYL